MIVAAGLGTRLRPLTNLRAKPALPVRGLPLIGYTLALLHHHGVREVVINTHHLPETLEAAARAECPDGLALAFSREQTLLDTGGGIRRVADFLRGSDPCLVVGGDMLIDVDLGALLRLHRERGDAVTMLLREDPRSASFGSVGVDAGGSVRRIGSRFDLGGGERRAGVYTWVNVVSRRLLATLPQREIFSHFEGWWWPLLQAGARDVRGCFEPCTWEPVGTPEEYLAVNRAPLRFPWLDADARARARGVRFDSDCVIGAGASLGAGARLREVVVWEAERVPAGLHAERGVFAGGAFHAVDGPHGGIGGTTSA
jgi:mannose-1-phosphate guanylyltransferase